MESVFGEAFQIFLEEHPRDAEEIIGKCLLSSRARLAARAARDTVLRKGALEGLTLPGKLADCSSKDTERTELYIVEGDSAGGSAKQARNREFQAILPLRGKILNVERARLDKLLTNNEVKNLVIALGTNIGEGFDLSTKRYGRVVIMTDADVDGAHIRTLLLTLFYRYFPVLITNGNIFIAMPPLYRIQVGKAVRYAYDDDEKVKIIGEMTAGKGDKAAVVKVEIEETSEATAEASTSVYEGEATSASGGVKVNIQRYKGLGEMNPDQLWETTMDPATRLMKQVMIEDAEKADETFDTLMGAEVAPRKNSSNARKGRRELGHLNVRN